MIRIFDCNVLYLCELAIYLNIYWICLYVDIPVDETDVHTRPTGDHTIQIRS